MSATPSIQAVLWDLGGVIVRTHDWSGRIRWEDRLGLQPFGLSDLIFNSEMGRRASLGETTSQELWSWVAGRLGLADEARKELKKDFWAGDRVDRDLVNFIRSLQPNYKTGLISNAWSDLRDAIENQLCIADAFDEIVISAEVGILKPDPGIYQLALQRLQIQAQEAVFIDDFPENTAGAQDIGMQAILFRDPEQTLSELRLLLTPSEP